MCRLNSINPVLRHSHMDRIRAHDLRCQSFLAATKHLQYHFSLSACPSVCLSHLFHNVAVMYHHEIFRSYYHDKSDVHAKGQGQRSKIKVTEDKQQFSRFRTVTPVWIYTWQWNYAQSLMWHMRSALLFFMVIRQISRSHGVIKWRFGSALSVSGW